MEKINVFLIHGFLGHPSDWSKVKEELRSRFPEANVQSVHLFKEELLNPTVSLKKWGANFRSWLIENTEPGDRNIVMGYSLGGRLTLHALDKASDILEQVFIVSANTGIRDYRTEFDPQSKERHDRWLADTKWAELFYKGSWDDVLGLWNAQAVFGGTHTEPERPEIRYTRDSLALALTNWSLAQQEDLRRMLAKNLEKVQWIVGGLDEKYIGIAEGLRKDIPDFSYRIVKDSSHRILFDKPSDLANIISAYLS